MGMYITWEVASTQTETITAVTDELTMNYVMNLYSLNLNTNGVNYTNGQAGTLNPSDNPFKFFFYTSWLMATGDVATGGPKNGSTPYDAFIADIDIAVTEGTPDTFTFTEGTVSDYGCADAACATNAADGTDESFSWGTNAASGAAGLCTEVWNVTTGTGLVADNQAESAICTKIEVAVKRALANPSGDGADIATAADVEDANLSFRKYSVAAGWRAGCASTDDFTCDRVNTVINSNTVNLSYDFTAQTVDYYDGFFVARSLYTGAMGKISVAAAIIASSAALLTF